MTKIISQFINLFATPTPVINSENIVVKANEISSIYYKDTIQKATLPDDTFSIQATVPVKNLETKIAPKKTLKEELEQMSREDAHLFQLLIECLKTSRLQSNDFSFLDQDMLKKEQLLLKEKQKHFLTLQEELQKNSKYAAIASWVNSILLGTTMLYSLATIGNKLATVDVLSALSNGADPLMRGIGISIAVTNSLTTAAKIYCKEKKDKSSELSYTAKEECEKENKLIEKIAEKAKKDLKASSRCDKELRIALSSLHENARLN